MSNTSTPPPEALPSTNRLVRSTLAAGAVAAVLAVTCVLPAEYAIDPTGIGRVLGLTKMGEIKRDADTQAAKERKVLLDEQMLGASAVRIAQGTHIMSDAGDGIAAWARLAQAAPAAPAASTKAPPAAVPQAGAPKTDTVEVILPPGEKIEIKAWMKKGEAFDYQWSTTGGTINYNFHGEKINAPASEYTEYKKGVSATEKGTFKAGYDGTHGWAWRNRTKQPITVKATVTGSYEKFGKKTD